MMERREFADGTYFVVEYPWGLFRGGAALCPDGKVRKLARIATTADTFYSVPAAVRARGRYVAGFVMVESRGGYSTESESDPAVLKFIPYKTRKNAALVAG